MKISRGQVLTALSLSAIILLGIIIYGISLIRNGSSTLLDLDPFRIIRAIQSIMVTGILPKYDALSSAPAGTYSTFENSHGYYWIVSDFGLFTGLSPSQALAISPLIFLSVELVVIYAITLSVSKSNLAALFACLFSVGLTGWPALTIMGADPVAENLGGPIFLIGIFLMLLLHSSRSYSLVGILGFVDGTAVQIHPVTYYFLNVILAANLVVLLIQKQWNLFRRIVIAICSSIFGIALLSLSGTNLLLVQRFSNGAYWLALLKPYIYTLTNQVLADEIGVVSIFLAIVATSLILVFKSKRHYALVVWASTLYGYVLIGQFIAFSPYGYLAKYVPFYAPLALSARIAPYFPPALAILAGVAIGEFIVPQIQQFEKIVKISPQKITMIIIVLTVLATTPQVIGAFQYTSSYSAAFSTAPAFDGLYSWINSHTTNNSVFIVNDLGDGEYIKVFSPRPVVFTNSEEDLGAADIIERATLQTCVFLPMCNSNSTLHLIKQYRINYAVILNPALLVNQNTSSLIFFNDNPLSLNQYLTWFCTRPYFKLVFNDSNSFVYSVTYPNGQQ